MATASTGWSCTHGAYVVSETNTHATIRVTCYWQNINWTYNINHVSAWVYCNGGEQQVKWSSNVTASSGNAAYSLGYADFTIEKGTSAKSISCYATITSNSSYVSGTKSSSASSVSVSAKPSYTVSYDANGGTGAPSNQTKWYDTNLTLSSASPAKTGHTFSKWNTNADGSGTSYNSGATYSGNAGLTLYAIWTADTYDVVYDANDGTGAPDKQTKTYGVDLILSSTKPTRTNYNFLGWSTSSNGGVVYNSGATYTNNSAVTLYAVWELAYVKPRINNFSAERCDADGTDNESGTSIKVSFDWATDETVSAIGAQYKLQTSADWNILSLDYSGTTSGSITQVIAQGNISIESSYEIRVLVTDSGGTTFSRTLPIGTIKFPIDVKAKGAGVAIGKVAETDGLFEVDFKTKLTGGLDGDIHWKEDGYGDKFAISPSFEGSGDLNLLKIQGAVGDANTNPSLYDLITISGLSGNMWIKGNADAKNLLIHRGTASDLNAIKDTCGIYLYDDNTSNRPSNLAAWGSVINYKCSSWSYQIAFGNYLIDTEPQLLAVRTYVNDVWIDWQYVGGRKKTLYENAEGSSGTITLSESAANFEYLEIYYLSTSDSGTGYAQNSTRVYKPNGKSAWLSTGYCGPSDFNVKLCSVLISGTQITRPYGYWEFNHNRAETTNYIGITKVVGYE